MQEQESVRCVHLLGYGKNWRNFKTAIEKAMISCTENGQIIQNHFDAGIKMVSIGSGAQRPEDDYNLTRLACYLIAMNGNPRKPEIAHAQNYFALTTHYFVGNEVRKTLETFHAPMPETLPAAPSITNDRIEQCNCFMPLRLL